MARKKTITREQVLDAAYKVVATEGFAKFTARNIANKMGCSTQPIYLEFKNMSDLKSALVEKIHHYLETEVFPVEHTGNKIIDLALNYIGFASKEKRIYRAVYLEEKGGGKAIQEFSYEYFKRVVKSDPTYQDLDEKQIESLHNGTWIIATGIAVLKSSGIISPDEETIKQLMQDSIDSILQRQIEIEFA